MALHVLTLVLLTFIVYTVCGVYLYQHTRTASPMVDVELGAGSYAMLPDGYPLEKGEVFIWGDGGEGGYVGGCYDDGDVVSVSSILGGAEESGG